MKGGTTSTISHKSHVNDWSLLSQLRARETSRFHFNPDLATHDRLTPSSYVADCVRRLPTHFHHILLAHTGCVNAVTVSNGVGRWIASGGDDQRVLLWDAYKSIKPVYPLQTVHEPESQPSAAATRSSSSASTVAIRPSVYNTSYPRAGFIHPGFLASFKQHRANIFGITFTADNTRMLSCGLDAQINLYDLNAGVGDSNTPASRSFKGHVQSVHKIAFLPDHSEVFLSGSTDRTIRLWDLRVSDKSQYSAGFSYPINGLSISPVDSNKFVTAGASLCLHDMRKLHPTAHNVNGASVTSSADGSGSTAAPARTTRATAAAAASRGGEGVRGGSASEVLRRILASQRRENAPAARRAASSDGDAADASMNDGSEEAADDDDEDEDDEIEFEEEEDEGPLGIDAFMRMFLLGRSVSARPAQNLMKYELKIQLPRPPTSASGGKKGKKKKSKSAAAAAAKKGTASASSTTRGRGRGRAAATAASSGSRGGRGRGRGRAGATASRSARSRSRSRGRANEEEDADKSHDKDDDDDDKADKESTEEKPSVRRSRRIAANDKEKDPDIEDATESADEDENGGDSDDSDFSRVNALEAMRDVDASSVEFSQDGRSIAVCMMESKPLVFDVDDPVPRLRLESVNAFNGYRNTTTHKSAIFVGPDDRFICAGSDSFGIYLWDRTLQKQDVLASPETNPKNQSTFLNACKVIHGHRSVPNNQCYHRSLNQILSCGVEKVVRIFHLTRPAVPRQDGSRELSHPREEEQLEDGEIVSHEELFHLLKRHSLRTDKDQDTADKPIVTSTSSPSELGKRKTLASAEDEDQRVEEKKQKPDSSSASGSDTAMEDVNNNAAASAAASSSAAAVESKEKETADEETSSARPRRRAAAAAAEAAISKGHRGTRRSSRLQFAGNTSATPASTSSSSSTPRVPLDPQYRMVRQYFTPRQPFSRSQAHYVMSGSNEWSFGAARSMFAEGVSDGEPDLGGGDDDSMAEDRQCLAQFDLHLLRAVTEESDDEYDDEDDDDDDDDDDDGSGISIDMDALDPEQREAVRQALGIEEVEDDDEDGASTHDSMDD